jgi:hypothetical protein
LQLLVSIFLSGKSENFEQCFSDGLIVPLIGHGVNSNSAKFGHLFSYPMVLRPGTPGMVFSGRKINN